MGINNIQSRIRRLDNLSIILFSLFFITSFINRDISSICLIGLLITNLLNYKKTVKSLQENKSLVYCVIIFIFFIIFSAFYHNSPLSELDNYIRLFILIPLLSLTLQRKHLSYLLVISSILSIFYFYFESDFVSRYSGSSSHVITYGVMITTLLFLLEINFQPTNYFIKIFKYIILSNLLIILFFTKSITSLVCLIFGIFYLLYLRVEKKSFTRVVSSLILLFILIVPAQYFLLDEYDVKNDIDIIEHVNMFFYNEDYYYYRSTKDRLGFYWFGLNSIYDNALLGIGPHNIEERLTNFYQGKEYVVVARDHLHNEYIDIAAKFGVISALLFISILYFMFKSNSSNYTVSKNIVALIYSISMLSQSHFAHHQATIFFIVLIYVFITRLSSEKNKPS